MPAKERGMAIYIVFAETNSVNSRSEEEVEIPDEELDGLSEEQRDAALNTVMQQYLANVVDFGIYKKGE
jgi:hypothetical protein